MKIFDYEVLFLKYYKRQYNACYIKVEHNKCKLSTQVTLYNERRNALKHKPTYYGVTVNKMFSLLKPNHIYNIDELLTTYERE